MKRHRPVSYLILCALMLAAASAAFENVSGGQAGAPVNVRLDVNDPSGQARVALYYDTDLNPSNGLTLITSGLPLAQAGQYVWNTSGVSAGRLER